MAYFKHHTDRLRYLITYQMLFVLKSSQLLGPCATRNLTYLSRGKWLFMPQSPLRHVDKMGPYRVPFVHIVTLIARFVGPTWGPSGADRTQVGPMLAPRTLLSGEVINHNHQCHVNTALYLRPKNKCRVIVVMILYMWYVNCIIVLEEILSKIL